MSDKTKTAQEIVIGDVVDTAHGPCRVYSATPVDDGIVIGFITESSGTDWGDVFRSDFPFTLAPGE